MTWVGLIKVVLGKQLSGVGSLQPNRVHLHGFCSPNSHIRCHLKNRSKRYGSSRSFTDFALLAEK